MKASEPKKSFWEVKYESFVEKFQIHYADACHGMYIAEYGGTPSPIIDVNVLSLSILTACVPSEFTHDYIQNLHPHAQIFFKGANLEIF